MDDITSILDSLVDVRESISNADIPVLSLLL